jgi:CheY-like chemotaxis protein
MSGSQTIAIININYNLSVALTAYAMKGDRKMFIDNKFDGYIPKPVEVHELQEIVAGYLY